ncbi:hypothetical protein OROMI_030697 [Orobanche minor]
MLIPRLQISTHEVPFIDCTEVFVTAQHVPAMELVIGHGKFRGTVLVPSEGLAEAMEARLDILGHSAINVQVADGVLPKAAPTLLSRIATAKRQGDSLPSPSSKKMRVESPSSDKSSNKSSNGSSDESSIGGSSSGKSSSGGSGESDFADDYDLALYNWGEYDGEGTVSDDDAL